MKNNSNSNLVNWKNCPLLVDFVLMSNFFALNSFAVELIAGILAMDRE